MDQEFHGSDSIEIKVIINGQPLCVLVKSRMHLADFLRQDLELRGTHLGCEHGVCGACTVLLDGRTARGCLTLAAQVDGKSVETIEGLSQRGELAQLQEAFIARNAAQCAFCSSGMLLTAYELLSEGKRIGRDEIRNYMSGNICRCTGYQSIIDAIESVMAGRFGDEGL